MPWSKGAARRAMRNVIGQELKTLYQVPQHLPQRMRALLMQLNVRHEEE